MKRGPTLFDAARFLEENFGTPDGIVCIASRFGVDVPSRDTIRKWFERGSISGEWLSVLIVLMETQTGSPVSLKAYLKIRGLEYGIFS
jgi:hypothetical protein